MKSIEEELVVAMQFCERFKEAEDCKAARMREQDERRNKIREAVKEKVKELYPHLPINALIGKTNQMLRAYMENLPLCDNKE